MKPFVDCSDWADTEGSQAALCTANAFPLLHHVWYSTHAASCKNCLAYAGSFHVTCRLAVRLNTQEQECVIKVTTMQMHDGARMCIRWMNAPAG